MPPKRKQPASASTSPKKPRQTVLNTVKLNPQASSDRPASRVTTTASTSTSIPSPDPPTFTIPFSPHEILCQRFPSSKLPTTATLIFTHGAGGGISNPATSLFAKGFSSASPSLVAINFQGTMNLASRVKAFHAVITHEDVASASADVGEVVPGGRSMGARAAVITLKELGLKKGGKLVLASYPLVGQNGEVRDKILLDIDPDVQVLFISGDADNMCDMKQLARVREKMKAKTWLIEVKGADHGMSLKPKDAVDRVREFVGCAAGTWVRGEGLEDGKTECVLRWDAHGRKVVDEGWREPGDPRTGSLKADDQEDTISSKDGVEAEKSSEQPPSKRRRKD